MGGRSVFFGRIIAALGAVVAAVAILPAAGVSAPGKPFTATIAPSTFVPGASSTWGYRITDADHTGAATSQPLGSAHITIPTNWTVTRVSAVGPAGKTWGADVNGTTIEVNAATQGDRLAGGEFVVVNITATPSCGASSSSAWDIAVKQSNNFLGAGNDFFLDSSRPALTSTSGAGPLNSFTITTSPSPATAGQGFTVTATAYDTCGRVKTDYAPVGLTPTGTLSNSSIAPASDLTGVQPVYGAFNWTQGVGTATVVAKNAETNRTVTITDGATTATSLPFSVQPGPLFPTFANQPGDAQVSSAIYNDVVNQTPVTVGVADAYGNQAPDTTTVVTMSSTPAGLTGATSAATSSGVASFSNMNIAAVGTYTLTAHVGSARDTSSSFEIVTTLKVCNNTNKCTAPASSANGNQSADTTMTSSTGTFQSAVLESTFAAPPGGGCGFSPISGTKASHVQVRATANITDTKPTFTITFTIPKATLKAAKLDNLGASHFQLCLGAKRLNGGTQGWIDASGHVTTADADGFFWGVVPAASGSLPADNPYISSQNKTGSGDLVIVLVKPWPWDGWGYC